MRSTKTGIPISHAASRWDKFKWRGIRCKWFCASGYDKEMEISLLRIYPEKKQAIVSQEVVCKSNHFAEKFNLDITLLLFFQRRKSKVLNSAMNMNCCITLRYFLSINIDFFNPKKQYFTIIIMLFILVLVNVSELHTILFPLQTTLNFN